MKHNEMKNKTQQPKNIQDVFTERQKFNLITNRMNSSIASTGDKGKRTAIERADKLNIFLTQNKGKGPPGRQRSPVDFSPDRVQNPVRDITNSPIHSLNSKFSFGKTNSDGFETITNSEIDDYKKYKFHFIQLLNSITMKKQIFILILAVFASVTVAFGQATHFSPATTVTCPSDALNPIAGKEYNYSAVIAPPGGTARWHVVAGTTTTTFISSGAWAPTDETVGGDYLLNVTPAAFNPMSGAATSPSTVSITWKSTGLAQVINDANRRLFLGLEYAGPTCNNNLQVWEIKPKNAFTIDVFNTDGTNPLGAAGSTASACYSSIASAIYSPGSPANVTMNYGTNTITYEIVAANFTGSFSSTVQLSGLQGGQTADISWGYTIATANTNSLATNAGNGNYGPIAATIAAGTDTGTGVSVFVRVIVHNNGYEGLTNDGIILAADAVDSAGQDDVKVSDCTAETPFTDAATFTLTQRPTVNGEVPASFLNKN